MVQREAQVLFRRCEETLVLGKLGGDLDIAAGRQAARFAAISALATIRSALGTLDAVKQVVSLRGVVNSAPDFIGHTQVIDGASEVFVDVFGDAGRHPARLSVSRPCRRTWRWRSN